jgi:glycosyltransferase involved in cell wall biosynthesis
VFVLAWDREDEFKTVENVDGAVVRSFTLGASRSRFGLALGALVFQIVLVLESFRLIGRLGRKPIVHAHDFNTLLAGCFLRLFRLSAGLVYDAHELAYAAYGEFFSPSIGNIIRLVEERLIRHVDSIITVSPAFADYYRRFGRKTELVYNCPRASDVPRLSRKKLRTRLGLPPNAFIVSYVGTARYDSRLDLFLSVAKLLGADERVMFLFVGGDENGGPLAPDVKRIARGARVTFLPFTNPGPDALAYVAASDLTWAIYNRQSLNMRMTLPWKFFESLACCVPVLVMKGTLLEELVGRLRCGFVSNTDDPAEISNLVSSLLDDSAKMRKTVFPEKGRIADEFTWETMSRKLTEIYTAIH